MNTLHLKFKRSFWVDAAIGKCYQNGMFTRLKSLLATVVFAAIFASALLAVPASAQVDLSGEWGQKLHEDAFERGHGPEIGDYTGVPINDQARMRADTWDSEKWIEIEHECEPHPADYAPRGPANMRVWPDLDPLTEQIVAWHTTMMWMLPQRTIYMDGRPHPPEYAVHTWEGFSTGEWEGDMLRVVTTHLKEGWVRRNGLPRSDRATMVEYYIRHGDFFTLVSLTKDPAYLTERLIRSSNWILDPGYALTPSHCIPSVEIEHAKGWVAHHLPGTNKFLHEFAEAHGVPEEAVRGGAETMYPEYEWKLATMPVPPLPRNAAPKSPHGTFTDMFGDSHEVKETDTVNPKENAKQKDKP